MRIRRAEPADAPAVHDLTQRAYAHYVERIGGRPGPMDDDHAEQVRQGQVHVAEDGEIAGILVLVREPDHLLIANVAVDPGRQRQGIGRRLLDFAESRAREEGMPELRLYTHVRMTENIALYARLGYVETHRRSEHGFERVFMTKPLTRP